MKRLVVVVLLLALLCAGCAGGGAAPEDNAGAEPGRQAVSRDEARTQNGETTAVDQRAVVPGADPGQPGASSGAASGSNAGVSSGPAAGKKETPASADTGKAETSPGVPASKVTLWVTRDFAQDLLYDKEVAFNPGDSVMEILNKHLNIKTGYGGGFVESINGLASGYTGADKVTRDWFYYVNGIITAVGALDYKPAPGDVIWWDYHDWGGAVFTPALIGAFPGPFTCGYRGQNPGTVVLTASGCEQQGRQLAEYLRSAGVKNVNVRSYEEKIVAGSEQITLAVGLWEQFAGEKFWQGVQKQRKKTGLFIEFAPDYFAALDMNGEVVHRYHEHAGAITATGSGMGDPTPVWLITGLDQSGLNGAVDVFIDRPGSFERYFGAIVSGGKVIAVPAG